MGKSNVQLSAATAPGRRRHELWSVEQRVSTYSGAWNVGFQMRDVSRQARERIKVLLAKQGVNIGMWPYLWALYQEDGLPQFKLAKMVRSGGPTVVNAINQLERKGLAKRVRSSEDLRVAHVFLTDKAHTMRFDIARCVSDVNEVALQFLDDTEVETLIALLKRVEIGLNSPA